MNFCERTITPRVPHPGLSTPVPYGILLSPTAAAWRTERVPHQVPRGDAPAIVIPSFVTEREYSSEEGRPATSLNLVSESIVKKIEPFLGFVAIFQSNMATKSGLKISLKSFGEFGECWGDERAPIFVDSRCKPLANNDLTDTVEREFLPCRSLLKWSRWDSQKPPIA